jgi:hypothetical protein
MTPQLRGFILVWSEGKYGYELGGDGLRSLGNHRI